MKLLNKLIRYICDCGNKCLVSNQPKKCHCGNPRWKILKYQESYKVGESDWIHPNGEV